MKNKELFIFDLDGTLVDAYRAIDASLNSARKKFGYEPIGHDEAKRAVGFGIKPFVQAFFPKKLHVAALAAYSKHHDGALKKYAKPKQFAKMLLYRLKQKKKYLAIASNRPAYYTDIILEKLDMKKYFDYILCGDQINSLKPKPGILYNVVEKLGVLKKAALYVGDMDVDLETAQRAKMDAVFITGGSCTLKDVKQYKDKIVVNSLKELYEVIVNS